jgi:hypothetical protein
MTRRYSAASALAASGSMGPESVFCNGVNDRMNYTALRTCHSGPFWPVFGPGKPVKENTDVLR